MYSIRKYKPTDKEQLRYICKETACIKDKNKRRLLDSIAIVYNDYFTENEPDNIFVAVNSDDIPVGYVISATDIDLFREKMLTVYMKQIIKVFPTSVFILLSSVIAVHITKKEYRTHLHIDLLPEAQRQGLGTKLIDALTLHLKEKGISNVSVLTISRKSMGYNFYNKYGFRIIQEVTKNRITMTYDIK